MTANGKGLAKAGVLKAPHFTLALRYVKSTKVPNLYISPAFRQANVLVAQLVPYIRELTKNSS